MSINCLPYPHQSWWSPVWRGLVVDPQAKHYRGIGMAVWLFLYLLLHADRKTGVVKRRCHTIMRDTGVPLRTVQRWLSVLQRKGYILTIFNGHSQVIHIQKWRVI